MTDEGRQGDPMDAVEMLNVMRNIAAGARGLYAEFVEQGFTEAEAMRLTAAWLHGSAGGKLE